MITLNLRPGAQFCVLLTGLLTFVGAQPVAAATQGDLGAQSTGTINIALTVKPMVQISGLQDITLTTTAGNPAAGTSPLCVFSNAEGNYQIQASGSGPADSFRLTSTTGSVPYTVTLEDPDGVTPLSPMAPASRKSAPGGLSCDEHQSRIAVAIPAEQAQPGVYTGTLTLMVSPD